MENPDNVEQWCEKNAKSIGKLDVLIHNAGITMRELLMNTEIGIGQKLMNVHFLSVFALTKGLLKNMKTGGQGSVICGVGSIAGINGLGIRTMYSSMKGSMEGFFKSLASEVKSDNIHSMVIHLGYIQTNVAKNALVGDGSKTFGKTDPNIKKGLPVRECADRMIDSIVLRNSHEVWICNGMMMNIKMFLPKLFPWIGDYNLYHDLKKQLSGLKEAK